MCPSQQLSRPPLPPDEEPFLIFANRYYLRKLNLDGSNYTLLKQVPDPPSSPHCLPRPTATSLTQYSPLFSTLGPMAIPPLTSPAIHVLTLRLLTPQTKGLNNAVALDFDYREQMIYWTDVTTQGSMIRRMHLNGSNVQVRPGAESQPVSLPRGPSLFQGHLPFFSPTPLNYSFSPLHTESPQDSACPYSSLP